MFMIGARTARDLIESIEQARRDLRSDHDDGRSDLDRLSKALLEARGLAQEASVAFDEATEARDLAVAYVAWLKQRIAFLLGLEDS